MKPVIKTYEAIFEPAKNKGVYGISLVENPAMQGLFIALSETEIKLKTVNEDERLLIGLVLEPNKPVYRNQDGEEFNIVFSEATVKELSHGFYKGGFQKNSSLEHNDEINGVTFVESWIVEDPKNDKSNALGLSYPKGSWMATMKVDDQELWDDYVKTGKVKGFSVDAMVALKELKFKSDIHMSEQKGVIEAIAKGLEKGFDSFLAKFKDKEAALELASIKTSNGEVDIQYEGDVMEVGGRVWIVADDGTEVALPAGEYELEDKRILVVSEDGKIGEVKEAVVEEMAGDKPAAESTATQVDAIAKATENAMKSILIKYSEGFEAKLKALSDKNTELESKLTQLSDQPAANPVKSAPVQSTATTSRGRLLEALQNT
jgi:hypothetical protein